MIIITPEAARELKALAVEGEPPVLKLDAGLDEGGDVECSVLLVSETPPEAEVETVSGITVAFCGMATSVFAGAVLGLDAEGQLTLEMAEGECDGCGDGCDCGSCGTDGHL